MWDLSAKFWKPDLSAPLVKENGRTPKDYISVGGREKVMDNLIGLRNRVFPVAMASTSDVGGRVGLD